MGEIAEDVVEGRCCQLCGGYFDSGKKELYKGKEIGVCAEHGYPVVCDECWEDLSKKQQKKYQQSLYPLI